MLLLLSIVVYLIMYSEYGSRRFNCVLMNFIINCGVTQGFSSLRKAVTTHVKKNTVFLQVCDVANQLLTRHSPFAPLGHVDE